jgi:hypothetical protein
MALKSPTETETAGELGTIPPADYCPDRTEWCADEADPFYTPPEERALICDPKAPPSNDDMRRLWNRQVTLNRIVRDAKRYRWAPPIQNSGALALHRPTSADEIVVNPEDAVHVSAWRHGLRRRWAQAQIRSAAAMEAIERSQPRCRGCQSVVVSNVAEFGPWSHGKGLLCPACRAALDWAGAQRHLDEHRAALDALL